MRKSISIVWFRQDLRLADNPAVEKAAQHGPVLPIYILDDCAPEECTLGTASKIWLHHSLTSLHTSLDRSLSVYRARLARSLSS